MRRRVPEQKLRGSDPTLLEVQVQDLLRRPIGQLEPINLLDLVSLSEVLEPPESLIVSLAEFQKRVRREVRDIPNGLEFSNFIDEIVKIEHPRVPLVFRQILRAETEREGRDIERLKEILEDWSLTEPTPFQLGDTPPPEIIEEIAVTRTPRKRPRKKAVSMEGSGVDEEKAQYLSELCLERLGGAREKGLAEMVLVAGVRHRAKEQYPTVLPHEVTAVLRRLKTAGRVRYSAGRWARSGSW